MSESRDGGTGLSNRPDLWSRRRFTAALAGGILAKPLAAEAQRAARSYVIGILDPGNPPTGPGPTYIAFRNRLAELGRAIQIEARYADGQPERLPALAADLVRLNVDLLVPIGSHATKAAKDATTTVPIVFFGVSSPVAAGVVASLARPGANVTGATDQLGDLQGKLLQLLSETVPHGSRIGMLTDFSNPGNTAGERAHFARIAQERGLAVIWADVRRPEDLDAAFATLSSGRVEALIVAVTPALLRERERVGKFAVHNKLPTISQGPGMVEAGLLMSYHPERADIWRQAADQVDRIFRGARPADLPVVQPTKFELVINLKTAKALGLTIPPSLLARADEVIE